jgi:hypothetical protein
MAGAVNGNENAGLDIRRHPNGRFLGSADANKLIASRRYFAPSKTTRFTILHVSSSMSRRRSLSSRKRGTTTDLDDIENDLSPARALHGFASGFDSDVKSLAIYYRDDSPRNSMYSVNGSSR